jgi:hypothetical protein
LSTLHEADFRTARREYPQRIPLHISGFDSDIRIARSAALQPHSSAVLLQIGMASGGVRVTASQKAAFPRIGIVITDSSGRLHHAAPDDRQEPVDK